jgi:pimeloyl-ACP methyl ester carboxylesterase
MTTFCLVHGAWHSAACWDPTVAELRGRGHDVIAMDLPCSDATAGIEEYVDVVLDALGDAQDVVLVGHSLGGLTAPVVADRRPVRELVLLAALVPKPGVAMSEDVATFDDTYAAGWEHRAAQQLVGQHGSSSWPVEAAVEVLYHDCEPALALWAARQLRPQAWTVAGQASPLRAYPDVETHAIVCADDRVLNPDGGARLAKARFGARVTWLEGGHSPMLARPEALADALTSSLA